MLLSIITKVMCNNIGYIIKYNIFLLYMNDLLDFGKENVLEFIQTTIKKNNNVKEDILDEIKESINEKKTNQILIRSTISIFILGILIITYLGISSWYESKNNERIQAEGALLTQIANNINVSKVNNKTPDEKKLVEEKNKTQIQKLEKLAEQNSSAYSALANIYLASISLMDSNHSKALYYYQRISKDASFSQTLQEYAKLI